MGAQNRYKGNFQSTDSIIELYGVSTVYAGEKRPAIKDITFSIEKGEYVLISGPNGAGKTTLLETILGLLKPRSGKIKLLGYEIPRRALEARKLCSYVPQDFIRSPDEVFKAKEVVAMGIASNRPLGKLRRDDWRRVEEALELLGISDLAERPIGKLSGGQQQKVFIARALVRDPRVLFLDEPFSALDSKSRIFLSDLLEELHKEDKTILLVAHAPPELKSIDREIYMVEGRIEKVIVH